MTDVLFLSSVFGTRKIAEPMGASLLTASLRERGFDVDILEPSLHGLTVAETVSRVEESSAPIVALSMLRDKHVQDVLDFVRLVRERCPERFVVLGGHGPSIAVQAIPAGRSPDSPPAPAPAPGRSLPAPLPAFVTRGAVVDPELVDRGKGPGDLGSDATCSSGLPLAAPEGASKPASSPYFDKSREYLEILRFADTYMLGESDTNFPALVGRVLAGAPWRDVAGVAYLDAEGRLVKNPLPPKIMELDTVPFMARDVYEQYLSLYERVLPASLLASRGCFYRCTFCSVVQYERLQEGSNHRQRSNDNIVAEMRELHDEYGCTEFNFEDDNFIVKNKRGRAKILEFARRVRDELDFDARFTLFCRADVVEHELFAALRDGGLSGIYFGIESVYPGDLEFFHKGLSADDILRALDTLIELGYSPCVGADLRIMIGYITWHPRTSFESLRATSDFIRRYDCPPKLLRRKLRLYSATEVVGDVVRMGLLAPWHKDGWLFADERIQGLDVYVDSFAGTVNKLRDRIRTLEKAALQYGFELDLAETLEVHRRRLDAWICSYFDAAVDCAAQEEEGAASPALAALDTAERDRFDAYVEGHGLQELVADGYARCGFDMGTADLFRK